MTRGRTIAFVVAVAVAGLCLGFTCIHTNRPLFHNTFSLYKSNGYWPGWGPYDPSTRQDHHRGSVIAVDCRRNMLLLIQSVDSLSPPSRGFLVANADGVVFADSDGSHLIVPSAPNRLIVLNANREEWRLALRPGEAIRVFEAISEYPLFDESAADCLDAHSAAVDTAVSELRSHLASHAEESE